MWELLKALERLSHEDRLAWLEALRRDYLMGCFDAATMENFGRLVELADHVSS